MLDAVSFWIPLYRLNALTRFVTGILSWTTVYYIVKNLPVAFSLRSQEALEIEIEQRKLAEEKYKNLNLELTQRVEERTAELQKLSEKIISINMRLKSHALSLLLIRKE